MKQQPAQQMRIGHGFDAHRLVAGRALILGGREIPHALGLLGHSDADVLTHALCDAILGACGCGDIGRHFPDSDPQYKGISSIKLLAHVIGLAAERHFRLVNADITVVAQRPKLAPHFPAMQKILAEACRVEPDAINLKASTTEQMGYTGREEGISAHAVVLMASQPLA
jgi:2-C-methyl-D-erythritol 2,4-cyclodiphosphate synthase